MVDAVDQPPLGVSRTKIMAALGTVVSIALPILVAKYPEITPMLLAYSTAAIGICSALASVFARKGGVNAAFNMGGILAGMIHTAAERAATKAVAEVAADAGRIVDTAASPVEDPRGRPVDMPA